MPTSQHGDGAEVRTSAAGLIAETDRRGWTDASGFSDATSASMCVTNIEAAKLKLRSALDRIQLPAVKAPASAKASNPTSKLLCPTF